MHDEVPIYKSRLFEELQPFLNGTKCLSTINAERLSKLLPWLLHPHRDGDIAVYTISKVPDHCSVYISSNAHEPFYDQRYFDFSHNIDSTRVSGESILRIIRSIMIIFYYSLISLLHSAMILLSWMGLL